GESGGARKKGRVGGGGRGGEEGRRKKRNTAYRQRAQRDLAVSLGRGAPQRSPPDHHRERRPVLGASRSRFRPGDGGAGAEPPALVDGTEGHDRLGHADEQGPRDDRG